MAILLDDTWEYNKWHMLTCQIAILAGDPKPVGLDSQLRVNQIHI